MGAYPLKWFRVHFSYRNIYDDKCTASWDIWECDKSAAEMSAIRRIYQHNRDNDRFSPGSKILDFKINLVRQL